MRRWVLIILLLVYPFQVALAVADRCCVTTPAGLTHHLAAGVDGGPAVQPVFVAEDGNSLLADPHCAACSLGHSVGLPSDASALPGAAHQSIAAAAAFPFLAPPPVARPERPKWPAAAE